MTDKGVCTLVDAITSEHQLPSLTALDLTNNNVGDTGVEKIAATAPMLRALKVLKLTGNTLIGDDSIHHLIRAGKSHASHPSVSIPVVRDP